MGSVNSQTKLSPNLVVPIFNVPSFVMPEKIQNSFLEFKQALQTDFLPNDSPEIAELSLELATLSFEEGVKATFEYFASLHASKNFL